MVTSVMMLRPSSGSASKKVGAEQIALRRIVGLKRRYVRAHGDRFMAGAEVQIDIQARFLVHFDKKGDTVTA